MPQLLSACERLIREGDGCELLLGTDTRRLLIEDGRVCGAEVTTIPFILISATTPFAAIGAAMMVRGIGIGLPIMPAMTAAFSVLSREQVNDASPQLTVLQRVGGSLGTAIIAVVLEAQVSTAHTQAALAAGFGHTYWWVMAVTLLALLPTLMLAQIERRARIAAPARLQRFADPARMEAARAKTRVLADALGRGPRQLLRPRARSRGTRHPSDRRYL